MKTLLTILSVFLILGLIGGGIGVLPILLFLLFLIFGYSAPLIRSEYQSLTEERRLVMMAPPPLEVNTDITATVYEKMPDPYEETLIK